MTYPFHDCGDEVIEGRLIRRARLHVDGHWMCIRPGQSWEDGDVRPICNPNPLSYPALVPACGSCCICLQTAPFALLSWPRI